MKINERYEIDIVIVEILPDGSYGNIYNDMSEFKKECPVSEYRFGYSIIDRKTGCVPEECSEWSYSVKEALYDYENKCTSGKNLLYIATDSCFSFYELTEKNGMKIHSDITEKDCIMRRNADGKYYKFKEAFKTYNNLNIVYEFEEVNIKDLNI